MTDGNDVWIGATLGGGRYRVSRKLAMGGMATVYLAEDVTLQKSVVVKTPHLAAQSDQAARNRFLREVETLKQLDVLPNIVPILDIGEHQQRPYFVTPFLSGGTLDDRQESDDLSWLAPIASALDCVHQQGLIHRDVKPSNILFNAAGDPFLGDFGIAKFLSDEEKLHARAKITMDGYIVGTPEYVAPEVLTGAEPDGRADQYGLALTVFHSLCGKLPFRERSRLTVVRQLDEERFALLQARCKNAEAVSSGLRRALAERVDERFPDCRTFAAALLAASPSGAEDVHPGDPSPRFQPFQKTDITNAQRRTQVQRRSGRKLPLVFGVLGGCLLLAIVVVTAVGAWSYLGGSAPDDPNIVVDGDDTGGSSRPDSFENAVGMKLVTATPLNSEPHAPATKYVGAYEVTQAEYDRVMETNPSRFNLAAADADRQLPVESVSIADAIEFCKRLSAHPEEAAAGRTYRLPTEDEWEVLALAGATGDFGIGEGTSLSSKQANFDGSFPAGDDTEFSVCLGRTCFVGSYSSNSLGIYDMHGNVAEWCLPAYQPDDRGDAAEYPTKGGSWMSHGIGCAAGAVVSKPANTCDGTLGFRVISEVSRDVTE